MMLSLFKVAFACERRPISGRYFSPPKKEYIGWREATTGNIVAATNAWPAFLAATVTRIQYFFGPFFKQMMDIVMHVNLTFSQTSMFSTPHFSFFL